MTRTVASRDEQVIVFQLERQVYGISVFSVLEIIRMQEILSLPDTPDFIEGIIEIRGQVIPVMDLRKKMGLPPAAYTPETRIIIVDMDDNTVGMIVDEVAEVLKIPAGTIDPPPPVMFGARRSYIKGIALLDDRIIILLDPAEVLYDHEKEVLESLVTAEQSG